MKGSVRKRKCKDGSISWIAVFEAPQKDGKRQQLFKTFRTKKAADTHILGELNRIEEGTYTAGGRMTFNELADAYLVASKDRIESTSLRWYERTLGQHARPTLGDMKLDAIKPLDVQRALDATRNVSRTNSKGRSLGPSSRRNILIGIRAVFAWGVRMSIISRNPATRVDTPKVPHREYPEFSLETARQYLAAVVGTEFEIIVPFALFTGTRRGEIAALRWSDVDLKRGRYSIRRSAAILDGKQIEKSPKSQRSRRTEALPPSLVVLLEQHRRNQAKRLDRLGLGLPTQEMTVFNREDGSAWNVNELSRRWSRFVRRVGLPPARLHDLRHGFASLSHEAGESLHAISTALGHSSIGITSSTYVHLFDSQKRDRAIRLDRFLAPAVSSATGEASEESAVSIS